MRRLAGRGGDPVVQLQTNFGGGKTHSMLALYHLFSGVAPRSLPGADEVLAAAGADPAAPLAPVRRAVLVGNKISPGNPVTKPDGTVVRTLWGELAHQLGGPEAFERVRADDERATNPGDALRTLLERCGPCLVLIDEWVSYARQLHDGSDLPAGSFETQFTFAQALTEAVKVTESCLLVVSLPASDTTVSGGAVSGGTAAGLPHSAGAAGADDAEVGGLRGREALDRLRNVGGAGRIALAGRERRGRLRDRAAAAVRAPGRAGGVQAARRDRARVRRRLPCAAHGVSLRMPRRGLRTAHPGRLPDPPRDLRPPLHGLVRARQVPAHPRRAAPDGGGDPQPVGRAATATRSSCRPPSPSRTRACRTS